MEYAFMFAACFVGGFFGAIVGNRRDKDTPLPVERVIRKAFRIPEPTPAIKANEIHNRWLFATDEVE